MANAKRASAKTRISKTVDVGNAGDVQECANEALKALSSGARTVVVVRGIGTQVSKTVAVAELVKSSLTGIHQCTTYAPVKVKGAKATEIRIELATTSEELDVHSPGYQAPDTIMGKPSPRKRKEWNDEPAVPLKKKVAKAFAATNASKGDANRKTVALSSA